MNKVHLVFCFLGYLNLVNAEKAGDISELLRLILNNARRQNGLPEASGLLPGHSLIRPTNTMLKSAADFPHEEESLVYGNKNNIGITYGNTADKVLYTGFRKENDLLATIMKLAEEQGFKGKLDKPSVIILHQVKQKSTPKGPKRLTRVADIVKVIPPKHPNYKLLAKVRNKIRKKEDKLLNTAGQVKLHFKSKKETLGEKTKRIQDVLNGLVPVSSIVSHKEDDSKERSSKVNEFLKILTKGKEKLPLEKKTKYIEDFLNNKLEVSQKDDNSKERSLKVKEFLNKLATSKEKIPLEKKTKYIEDFLNNKVEIVPVTSDIYNQDQNSVEEDENNANEVLDQYPEEIDESGLFANTRRKTSKKKKKYRDRDDKYESTDSEDSDVSASSDYERNPGNPFTIHRNKYKQNWLWNHFMDGDHMNINPLGPPFATLGPSGIDLFFGRKWWYYNQDDYKPMG